MMKTIYRILLITGAFLILYGWLCRIAGWYFFWESSTFGWAILAIGALLFLIGRSKKKKVEKKNRALEIIGIGFLALYLVVEMILLFVIPTTNAYKAATNYILSSDSLRAQVGRVRGFGLNAMGSISVSSRDSGEIGAAEIHLIVKGEKKFVDLAVGVEKTGWTTPWTIFAIE